MRVRAPPLPACAPAGRGAAAPRNAFGASAGRCRDGTLANGASRCRAAPSVRFVGRPLCCYTQCRAGVSWRPCWKASNRTNADLPSEPFGVQASRRHRRDEAPQCLVGECMHDCCKRYIHMHMHVFLSNGTQATQPKVGAAKRCRRMQPRRGAPRLPLHAPRSGPRRAPRRRTERAGEAPLRSRRGWRPGGRAGSCAQRSWRCRPGCGGLHPPRGKRRKWTLP